MSEPLPSKGNHFDASGFKELAREQKDISTTSIERKTPAHDRPSLFEEVFNLPKPRCCSTGDCCKGASPSTPFYKLWAKAAAGDEFARGFMSIFEPYSSHDEAAAVVPGLVERTKQAAAKSDEFKVDDDLVFYRCRYLSEDNRCQVYEDRPQFCRDYPDTPFVVMAPGCAYEGWGAACRDKYRAMEAETDELKTIQAELHRLDEAKGQASALAIASTFRTDEEQLKQLALVLSLTPTYLANPMVHVIPFK